MRPPSIPRSTTRRAVLQGTLAGLAGAAFVSLSRKSLAADAASIERVSDELALITGAGGNVLVRATAAGQVLVDSGNAASSDALLAALAELPGAGRVGTLFNSHWHLDQVGANTVFGKAGAAIVAHEKARARRATGY